MGCVGIISRSIFGHLYYIHTIYGSMVLYQIYKHYIHHVGERLIKKFKTITGGFISD